MNHGTKKLFQCACLIPFPYDMLKSRICIKQSLIHCTVTGILRLNLFYACCRLDNDVQVAIYIYI